MREDILSEITELETISEPIPPERLGGLISRLRSLYCNADFQAIKRRIETIIKNQIKIMARAENSEKVIRLLAGKEADLLANISSDELTLAVIPHNSSTKIAIFKGLNLVAKDEIPISIQLNTDVEYRVNQLRTFLMNHRISLDMISGIAVKGGYLQPSSGGTYLVDEEMIKDASNSPIEHPSNLGILIGARLKAKNQDILLTTTDPISTDEMGSPERMTGVAGYLRRGSGAHYLNHRSNARLICGLLNQRYEDSILITLHAGGGISTARHQNGKIVDVLNTFSDMPGANRSGNIPIEIIIEEIKGGRISIEELRRLVYNEGGLMSLAGTNDFKTLIDFREMGSNEIQREKIDIILTFYSEVIAKSIMALCAYPHPPSVIVISGGLSRSTRIVDEILSRVNIGVPLINFDETFDLELLLVENMLSRIRPERLKDYSKEKLIFNRNISSMKKILQARLFDEPVIRVKPLMPARCINDIIYMAREQAARFGCPRIGIVGANNEEAIEAANLANSEGRFRIAKFLLVGPFSEISRIAWDYDILIDNDNFTIIDAEDPISRSMSLYKNRVVNMLMKGSVMTEHIMRAFIETTKSMLGPNEKVFLSHVGVFEVPAYPKLLLISDAAINPAPDKKAKKKIIENALSVARALNIRCPKVAIISAVEKVNPSVASSVEAREIADEMSSSDEYIIEGPLSLDVAINPRIAEEKRYQGRIRGDADILIMPDIEAGNIIYKTLTVSSHAKIAGVVVGGKVPLILTSRGDSSLSKLASISLGILLYTLTNFKEE